MDEDLLYLKVHVDQYGEVWYVLGNGQPVDTHMSVIEFLLHPISAHLNRFRIIGMRQNIQLILALYARLPPKPVIEVCSPLACRTAKDRLDPIKVLYAMRQHKQAPSLGGWHQFNEDDYCALALTNHIQKQSGKLNRRSFDLLYKHPVWLPLSFIPHLNADACIYLLALIMDPRWYLDPLNPYRGSKLRSYLGLDLKTMRGVCENTNPQKYHVRCKLVLTAWNGPKDLRLLERPDYFVWRIQNEAYKKKNDSIYSMLRASQAFIEYLRLCWLAALGRGRHQNEPLFVPEYFFKERYETKAFYAHFTKALERK